MREEGEEGAFRGQGALVAQVMCQAHKWEIMCINWEFQIRQNSSADALGLDDY